MANTFSGLKTNPAVSITTFALAKFQKENA
jgi:hypothetical protein